MDGAAEPGLARGAQEQSRAVLTLEPNGSPVMRLLGYPGPGALVGPLDTGGLRA